MESFKLFAAAVERNKQPIYEVLRQLIKENTFVLEISSGTGQHVAYFAEKMPSVRFQPTEVCERSLKSIQAFKNDAHLSNVENAKYLDASSPPEKWLEGCAPSSVDYILNINMMHISKWQCTEGLFRGSGYWLKPGGLLITYGPYGRNNKITPQSNVSFNKMLRDENPEWGIRDIDLQLIPLAKEYGFELIDVKLLPANNHLLVWKKC